MKREILFKGKTKSKDGKWISGDLNHVFDGVFIFDRVDESELNSPNNYEVIPETVGQFTGMIDRNGVKVFEYDIVIANCAPSGAKSKKVKDHKCVVEYSEFHHGWCVLILDHEPGEKWMTGYMSYGRNGNALKVIGNIHDVKEPEFVSEAV